MTSSTSTHIDTTFLNRCIQTLDKAFSLLQQAEAKSLEYDLYCSATINEVGRWFIYRDNRNSTTHDCGLALTEKNLPLLPQFVSDAQSLLTTINNHPHDS